jgi:hypothetical protein
VRRDSVLVLGAQCPVLVLGAGARCWCTVLVRRAGARCWCSVLVLGADGMKRLVLAIVVAAGIVGCRSKPEPIRLNGRTLVVENQTNTEWRNVTVTINGYYRGGSPSLAAGGELDAGLSSFSTGLGQKFDPGRETVHTVEVRATDASGQPVSLDWSDRKQEAK